VLNEAQSNYSTVENIQWFNGTHSLIALFEKAVTGAYSELISVLPFR
jgi:hypothetical protein